MNQSRPFKRQSTFLNEWKGHTAKIDARVEWWRIAFWKGNVQSRQTERKAGDRNEKGTPNSGCPPTPGMGRRLLKTTATPPRSPRLHSAHSLAIPGTSLRPF